MDTMSRFLAKLRELLRLKVKDRDLSESDFDECVRQARSHVGGTVRWEKARAEKEAKEFAEQGHSGLMVGYWIPEEIGRQLAIDDGEKPADLHMTLAYCGDVMALGDVAIARGLVAAEMVCRQTAPLMGKVSGFGRFAASATSDGKDVLYASVDMPDLPVFRQRLVEALTGAGCGPRQDHGFTPHITLAYIDPEFSMPEMDMPKRSLRVDRIVFVAGDKRTEIPLMGRGNDWIAAEPRALVYNRLEDLPEAVQALPEAAQKLWMKTWNGVHGQHPDDEALAAKMAWNALKMVGWKKEGDRWVKTTEIDDDACMAAVEGSSMNTFRLLGEVSLSEDGKTGSVQIFPAVGTYKHPRYGELAVSKEFLKAVKANFEAKIYQQELPLTIDLEHQSTLSGAAGWIADVEIRGDTGMWATVEFNDRGRQLVGEDAYRYFSPEFYDQWQDPATNKKFENVLVGGALTNRPFFKGMAPVVMASDGMFAFTELVEPEQAAEMPDAESMDAMMAQMEAMMQMMRSMMGKGMDKEKMAELAGMMTKLKKQMPDHDEGEHEMAEGETKTEDGQAYPREAYLFAPADASPSEWKLRVWESPSLKVTRRQLGAAAAALGKGFRGQTVQLPPGEKEKAITKLRGLYAKLDVPPDEMPAHVRASLLEAGLSEDEASIVLGELGLAEETGGNDVGMTDDEARQLSETMESLKSLGERLATAETRAASEEEARKAAEQVAKAAGDRVAALERDANRKQLSEFVRANRMAFQGEVPECVDKLERMQGKLGEDFQEYLNERQSWHERIATSELFTQQSRPVTAPTGAQAEFDTAVARSMTENPALTHAEAIAKVARENPGLYDRYDKAFKTGIKRA